MLTWIWLATGILLTAAELLVPGLVVIFLGVAALLTAGFCGIGLIDSAAVSVATWMGSSVLLVLLLRKAVLKWFPPEVRRDIDDEETDALGQVVIVVEDCHEDDSHGRIRFGGTTWPASSSKGTIPAGQKARLLFRDNLAWLIEPLSELEQEDPLQDDLGQDQPVETGQEKDTST